LRFGYCAFAVSRDLCVGRKFYPHIWNPQPRFVYSLCSFGGSTMKVNKLYAKIIHAPLLITVWVSAHARNHVICLRCPKCLIALVLEDVDLPYCTWKVEHIVAFTAIFTNICTAHAQKRLFMNFRCKFRHRCSIPPPDFLIECKISAIWRRFPLTFCILYAECPPYFYFRFVTPTDLESIQHALIPTPIISTNCEVDMTIHCRVRVFYLVIRYMPL